MTFDVDLDHLAKGGFIGALQCKVILPRFLPPPPPSPTFRLYTLEGSDCRQHLRIEELYLGWSIYIIYFKFFCTGHLTLLHLLLFAVSYLYQYGFTGIYFILWLIIQYFILSKLF